MVVEGVDLEVLTLPGGLIRRSPHLKVLIVIFPRQEVIDGGEAGQEAPAVGAQLGGREARSMVEAEGVETWIGRGDHGW